MARAIVSDVRAHRIVSGGSTLTMQTIRIARGRDGSRLWDKLAEIALAPRLELQYSKREILALYAAHAPSAVTSSASMPRLALFGRSAEQLSWRKLALWPCYRIVPLSFTRKTARDSEGEARSRAAATE